MGVCVCGGGGRLQMFPHVPVLVWIASRNMVSNEGLPWPCPGLMSSCIWLPDTKASLSSSKFLSVAIGNHRATVALFAVTFLCGLTAEDAWVMVVYWGVVLWGLKTQTRNALYVKAAFPGQCALEASTHPGVSWRHGNGTEKVFIF